jgi:hypothetical protein
MLLFESATKHDDRICLSAMKSTHDRFGDAAIAQLPLSVRSSVATADDLTA